MAIPSWYALLHFIKLSFNIVSFTGFRDDDLKEMGVASAVKWTKGDFELLDVFDTVIDTSSAFPDWTDVCSAEVVAALDEDLLMSDGESEEETLNKQSICSACKKVLN